MNRIFRLCFFQIIFLVAIRYWMLFTTVFAQEKILSRPKEYEVQQPSEENDNTYLVGKIPWIVYSVKENNKSYVRTDKREVKDSAGFLQEFFVGDDNDNMLHLFIDTKPSLNVDGDYVFSESKRDYGWIEKSNLLLYLHSYTLELGKVFKDTKKQDVTIGRVRKEIDSVKNLLKLTQDTLRGFNSTLRTTRDSLRKAQLSIDNVVSINFSPSEKSLNGVTVSVKVKKEDERFKNSKIEINGKKPLGYNIADEKWENPDFNKHRSWNDLVNDNEPMKFTFYPLQDYQVFFIYISDGAIEKPIIQKIVRTKLRELRKNQDKQGDLYKYCIGASNGVDRIPRKMQDAGEDEFFNELTSLSIKGSVNIYEQFKFFFQKIEVQTYAKRTNVRYYFFFSRSSLLDILLDIKNFKQRLGEYNIDMKQICIYWQDEKTKIVSSISETEINNLFLQNNNK